VYRQTEVASGQGVLSTLANGLAVLEELVGKPSTLRQLAQDVGLPRQTTYRLIHTLTTLGWVDRNRTDDTYSLSPRLWSLAARSFDLTDLRGSLAPTVRQLADTYGETVHLAVYDRGSVVYVDKQDGSHPIRSYTQLGGRAPAYCVATGKVLLAHKGPAEWDAVCAVGLVAHTDVTVSDPDRLRAELRGVERCGYAVNLGEWRAGVGGVAVPIASATGEVVAALGFSGPSDRIRPQLDTLIAALRDAVGWQQHQARVS